MIKNARFLKQNETNQRNKLSKLNKLNETNHVRNVINEECESGSKVAIAKSVQSNDMCDVNHVSTLLGHKEKREACTNVIAIERFVFHFCAF